MAVSIVCLCGVNAAWTAAAYKLFYEDVGAMHLASPVAWTITAVAEAIILVVFFKRMTKNKERDSEVKIVC